MYCSWYTMCACVGGGGGRWWSVVFVEDSHTQTHWWDARVNSAYMIISLFGWILANNSPNERLVNLMLSFWSGLLGRNFIVCVFSQNSHSSIIYVVYQQTQPTTCSEQKKTSTQKFEQCVHVANGAAFLISFLADINRVYPHFHRVSFSVCDALSSTRTNGSR